MVDFERSWSRFGVAAVRFSVEVLKKYEQELFVFVESKSPDLFPEIVKKREIDGNLRGRVGDLLKEFNSTFKE